MPPAVSLEKLPAGSGVVEVDDFEPRAIDSTGNFMDREVVRARIHTMLETGTLPCDDAERTWGGRGLGRHCSACGEEISASPLKSA